MPLLRRVTATTVAVATLVALSGCPALPDVTAAPRAGRHGGTQPAGLAAEHGLVRTGRGLSGAGIQGPVPAPGSCHYQHTANGEVLPDPHCTPGAIDTAVTQANIGQTICRAGGYSDSVRPPLELTEPLKYKMLAAYGVPASNIGDYELDHLVPESAGGSSNTYNLWPEPNNDARRYPRTEYVANDKDEIEHRVWESVCDHQDHLGRVQKLMATNWTRLTD
jgi:hypothetical protein